MKFNVQDLIDAGLVVAKEYGNGLKVLKYSRRVFFEGLWNTDPRLLECRGRVVDANWNVVVNPFTKVFNYLEQGAGKDLHPQCLVRVVDKKNGFLGCVTNTHEYGMIFSTTGTLDSDFACLLERVYKENESKYQTEYALPVGITFMFEVCDPSDPHVVDEAPGLYLIGARSTHGLGLCMPEALLDNLANQFNWLRPNHTLMPLNGVMAELKTCKHEGFIVKNPATDEAIFKGKSAHYLTKKLLMRLGKARVEQMFTDPEKFKKFLQDEEFFSFVDYANKHIGLELWKALSDQERRALIEGHMSRNSIF